MPAVYSVEVGTAKPGEGAPRRSTLSADKLLTTPEAGIETIFDVVQRSVRLFGDQPALGYRDVLHVHTETKQVQRTDSNGEAHLETKTWKYFECSDYKYWSYKTLGDKVKAASSGMANLGLSKDTLFNVYAATSHHWQLMAWACSCQSITFCTSYDSLGEEGLIHSLNEPEVVGVFTNADLLPMLLKVLAQTPTVKYIIYDGDRADSSLVDQLAQTRDGVRVITLDELLEDGQRNPKEYVPPKSEDTACIMYTSGSTGKPKGVIIRHSNLVASLGGVLTLLADYIKPGESYIAYLPLAHILEFIVECAMFFVGIPMGYGSVKTLTDTNMRNCIGDIRAFQPTIMVGVPAVWELIRKGIATKVKAGGPVKSKLFGGAMAAKQAAPALLGPIADAVVFKQVKQATGGRLKYALSGGAAISTETQEFLMTCLTTLIQGYGMTESCGMCAILPPAYARTKTVGMPVPSIEIKLRDVPEAGYYAARNPPQGEILIRGGSVTSGYFKRDDLNKEVFTEDGWFMTGDIGQWAEDGTLSIIDRVKNLVKLSGGEYIALERLEAAYKGCAIVGNIMVHADTSAKQPMAVVFVNEASLKHLSGGSTGNAEKLCQDPKIKAAALKELNATGKKAGFRSLEMLQEVILTPEEWTPQNGLLTAAQKLQRKQIFEHYKDQIKACYP